MEPMPPLTDPTAIAVIATSATLTTGLIIYAIIGAVKLQKFRNCIKAGDYAKIDLGGEYCRAEFVRYDHPFYIFREIESRGLFPCLKSKINKL